MDAQTAALFPDSFEESELGMVPKGWRVGKFSDICSISSGKRPSDRFDCQSQTASVPLYGGAGVMGFTSETLYGSQKILTGRVGTLGKIHIAHPPFWASDNVLVISPYNSKSFIFSYLWLSIIDINLLNRGSTQPLLTQKDLGAQLGIIPPDELIYLFEEFSENLFKKKKNNEVHAQYLADLRDTLLPRLISGQLRLPEAQAAVEGAL